MFNEDGRGENRIGQVAHTCGLLSAACPSFQCCELIGLRSAMWTINLCACIGVPGTACFHNQTAWWCILAVVVANCAHNMAPLESTLSVRRANLATRIMRIVALDRSLWELVLLKGKRLMIDTRSTVSP